ncbi:MAG: ROK family protein [Patescibacteria group bacterium]|nr:ROK family protein [Patescibacteria group bacterium]
MKNKLYIGVDLGGTKIQAGLVDHCGRILQRYKTLTELDKGGAAILDKLQKAVVAVWRDGVCGIGIGSRGNIDPKLGIIRNDHFFPKEFRNLRLATILSKSFGVPTVADNDVRCFTLGETLYGAAKGKRNVIGLTFGTGIGGGIIMNGELLHGRNNAAGEIGHMLVAFGHRSKCPCGQEDHWEAFASGTAMARAYHKKTGRWVLPSDFAKLARRGDRLAKKILQESAEIMGAGLASLTVIFNPDIIVIGGSVARDPWLWCPAMKSFKEKVKFPELGETPVVLSKLGGDANIVGAAALLMK